MYKAGHHLSIILVSKCKWYAMAVRWIKDGTKYIVYTDRARARVQAVNNSGIS